MLNVSTGNEIHSTHTTAPRHTCRELYSGQQMSYFYAFSITPNETEPTNKACPPGSFLQSLVGYRQLRAASLSTFARFTI